MAKGTARKGLGEIAAQAHRRYSAVEKAVTAGIHDAILAGIFQPGDRLRQEYRQRLIKFNDGQHPDADNSLAEQRHFACHGVGHTPGLFHHSGVYAYIRCFVLDWKP